MIRRSEGARRLPGSRLPGSFYARDTLTVAREVLGCILARREADGTWTLGRIVETEAYIGEDDPACHARSGRTPRTEVLYGPPGRAYVYFTYGMHHLVNLVTERHGFPAAVLIRALDPVAGLDRMGRRRGTDRLTALAAGPSRLCQALDIDLSLNRVSLAGPTLTVCDDGFLRGAVHAGPRIGIREGTDRPWRFCLADDPFVSRPRPGPRAVRGRNRVDSPRRSG